MRRIALAASAIAPAPAIKIIVGSLQEREH
jgi:hypothetical protein